MTKAASQTASRSKWVIGWFLEGFGFGWISTGKLHLLPWTGNADTALIFDSKAEADRKLIEWEIQGVGVGDFWIESLTKARVRL